MSVVPYTNPRPRQKKKHPTGSDVASTSIGTPPLMRFVQDQPTIVFAVSNTITGLSSSTDTFKTGNTSRTGNNLRPGAVRGPLATNSTRGEPTLVTLDQDIAAPK